MRISPFTDSFTNYATLVLSFEDAAVARTGKGRQEGLEDFMTSEITLEDVSILRIC
jgi:hypothetical protein